MPRTFLSRCIGHSMSPGPLTATRVGSTNDSSPHPASHCVCRLAGSRAHAPSVSLELCEGAGGSRTPAWQAPQEHTRGLTALSRCTGPARACQAGDSHHRMSSALTEEDGEGWATPLRKAFQRLPLTALFILTLELLAWPAPPAPAASLHLLPPHPSSQWLGELLVTGQGPARLDSSLL